MSPGKTADLRSAFFGLSNEKDFTMSNANGAMLLELRSDGARPNNERPHTGPEIDDDSEPGVDDGLLSPPSRPHTPSRPTTPSHFPDSAGPGFDINFGAPGVPVLTPGGTRMDVNVYAQKKTLAQGMMDIALLSANANQLRYVLDYQGTNPYFYMSVTLIALSLIFQLAVGIGLILNGRYNIKRDADVSNANRINNLTVIGIFVITATNVFLSAFAVTSVAPSIRLANLLHAEQVENASVSLA